MLAVRHASNILQSDFMLHRNLQLNQLEDKWNTLFHELALNLLLHLIQLTLSASGRTWQCLMLAPRSTWGSQWHVLGEYTKNINSAWKLFCPNYCQDQPPLSHPPQILILLFGAKYKISNIELNDCKGSGISPICNVLGTNPPWNFSKIGNILLYFQNPCHSMLLYINFDKRDSSIN